MLAKRVLKRALGCIELAVGGAQQSTATCAGGQRPGNPARLGLPFECSEDYLGPVERARADQGFDQVGVDSVHAWLLDAKALRTLNGAQQKRHGGRRVAEGKLEKAERAKIEGNGDRLHDRQALLDREACPLDVSEMRVNVRTDRRRATETLPELFGELETLLGIAGR